MTAPGDEKRPLLGGRSRLRQWIWAAVLVAVTFVAYLPCLHGGFVWDDDAWTIHPQELYDSPGGLLRIWTSLTALQQYYPLTGTTFWVDHHLWGGWTLPYHVQNVFWHAIAAVLFWWVLQILQVRGAWLAGGIFALHPVMVESVAWIAERKNVLSLALFLGALLSYARFAGNWEPEANTGPRRYWWGALALFTGALLAKVTAYVFAPTVLLICWWKRGRIVRNDVIALLPFFLLSVVIGAMVSWVERVHVGAEGVDWEFTFAQRFLLAGRALIFYVSKVLWPSGLCFMYLRWIPDPAAFAQWLYPLAIIGVVIGLGCFRHRLSRGFFTGVFFFAGTIFPVLGFLNVYGMRFASVADHWVYVPSLAVIALVVAGLHQAAQRWRAHWLLPAVAATLLPFFGLRTWQEAGQYRDVETLWLNTIEKNPSHWMPSYSLGLHHASEGRPAEALAWFEKSVALNPKHAIAYSNISAQLSKLGRHAEAVAACRKALALGADLPFVHFNLGEALFRTGQIDESILEFREAIAGDPRQSAFHYSLAGAYVKKGWGDDARASYLRTIEIEPNHVLAHFRLGNLYLKSGRTKDAVEHYQKAVTYNPGLAEAHANLGNALLQQGDLAESIEHSRRALQIDARLASPHLNVGLAFLRAGQHREALTAFSEASRIDPTQVSALANAAWVLAASPDAALRDGPRALEYALRAEQLCGGSDLFALRALAAAYAENGQFEQARQTVSRALKLPTAILNADTAAILQRDMDLYRASHQVRILGTP